MGRFTLQGRQKVTYYSNEYTQMQPSERCRPEKGSWPVTKEECRLYAETKNYAWAEAKSYRYWHDSRYVTDSNPEGRREIETSSIKGCSFQDGTVQNHMTWDDDRTPE